MLFILFILYELYELYDWILIYIYRYDIIRVYFILITVLKIDMNKEVVVSEIRLS